MKLAFSWYYNISWPFYYLWPSTRKHASCVLLPSSFYSDIAKQEDTLRILFFGDLMCTKREKVPRVHPKLKALFQTSDLVIGNLESPLIRYNKNNKARDMLFRHQMSEVFLREFLSALGVDPSKCILSIANNHIGDQGVKGLQATLYHLKNLGITPVGYCRSDTVPYIRVACKGITFGISAWTQWLNRHPFKRSSGVLNLRHIQKTNWKAVKKDGRIDCLIGFPHWGHEFQHFPRAGTRKTVWELANQDFDIIVGHHPHVLQPLEKLEQTYCLYSIGNLNGPSIMNLRWPMRLCALFEVRIFSSGPNHGKIAGYTLHFYVQQSVKGGNALIPIDKSSPMIKHKMLRRLSRLFPKTIFETSE